METAEEIQCEVCTSGHMATVCGKSREVKKWKDEPAASHWKPAGRIFITVTHYWFSVECNEKWIFWLSALARPKHHADVVKHDVMVLLFGVLEVKTYLGL